MRKCVRLALLGGAAMLFFLAHGGEGAAQGPGLVTFDIDPEIAGNTGGSLGAVEDCARADTPSPVFDNVADYNIDIVVSGDTQAPTAYEVSLSFDPSIVHIAAPSTDNLIKLPGATDLSDALPDADGTYSARAVYFGDSGTPGNGAIVRVGLDIGGTGVVMFTLNADPPPGYQSVAGVHDTEVDWGALALNVDCPTWIDVEKVSAKLIDAPGPNIDVSKIYEFRMESVLHNHGPLDLTVAYDFIKVVPPEGVHVSYHVTNDEEVCLDENGDTEYEDCSTPPLKWTKWVSPPGKMLVSYPVALPVSVRTTVTTEWDIHCTQPGKQTVKWGNETVSEWDPDPTNNWKPVELTVQCQGEGFKVLPLKINVPAGVTGQWSPEEREREKAILAEQIRRAVNEANMILKAANVRLEFELGKINWDVDGGLTDDEGKASKEQRETGHREGQRELDQKFGNGRGFKVIITNGFPDDPNTPEVDESGAAGMAAIKKDPPFGGSMIPVVHLASRTSRDLVHEFCHTFSLGRQHVVDDKVDPPKLADDNGHSDGENDVMNEGGTGTGLTPAQARECRKGAQTRAYEKERTGLAPELKMTPVDTKHASWTDDVNDVSTSYLDLSMGFLFAEGPTADLEVGINLRGLHPTATDVSSQFRILFDADNNVGTGSTFGSFSGIDRVLTIVLAGQFPFTAPAGSVTSELFDVALGTSTSLPAAAVERLVEIRDLLDPPDAPITVDSVDSLDQSFPLSLLGPLADQVPIGITATNLDTGEYDEASLLFEFNRAPGPLLEMSPLVGKPGDTVDLVGTRFSRLTTVTVLVDDTEVLTTTTLDDGSFSTSFQFPALPPDDYFITARDEAGLFDFSVFNVSGPVGGAVELAAGDRGFPARSADGPGPALYAALAGGAAAALAAVLAGAWYARRRWLR